MEEEIMGIRTPSTIHLRRKKISPVSPTATVASRRLSLDELDEHTLRTARRVDWRKHPELREHLLELLESHPELKSTRSEFSESWTWNRDFNFKGKGYKLWIQGVRRSREPFSESALSLQIREQNPDGTGWWMKSQLDLNPTDRDFSDAGDAGSEILQRMLGFLRSCDS
jgi:hypothetical protein